LSHYQPTNWFNVEKENEGHAKIADWMESYVAEHPDIDRIPRADIPEDIAELAISFDDWRAAYFDFLFKPTKAQKQELRTKRYDVDPL